MKCFPKITWFVGNSHCPSSAQQPSTRPSLPSHVPSVHWERAEGPGVVIREILERSRVHIMWAASGIGPALAAKRNRQSSVSKRSLGEFVLRGGLQGMGQNIVLGHGGSVQKQKWGRDGAT